jgi:sugar-specific transcriptional regulator TrmB
MEKLLKDALSDLGCSDKEIKFFITTYTTGPASITDLAKIAKMERSTAYFIADQLIAKGFLIEDLKRYKKLITTIEPKTLLRILAARQRKIGRHELALQENLPELQALYQASEIRPKLRTYEGKKGLLEIRRDLLAIRRQKVNFLPKNIMRTLLSKGNGEKFQSAF